MDLAEAYDLVADVGSGYFYDEVGDLSDDEILNRVRDDIQRTQLSGLGFWEDRRDAFKITSHECSDEDIHVMLNLFGHGDLDMERGRGFFEKIYEVMAHALELRNKPAAG
jgi:hypothetical protein